MELMLKMKELEIQAASKHQADMTTTQEGKKNK